MPGSFTIAWVLMASAWAAGDPDEAIRILQDRPGAASWEKQVRSILVDSHDTDGSGHLQTAPELGAVACSTWAAADAQVRSEWGAPLGRLYGFAPERTWLGSKLGIDESMRPAAFAALETCGLNTQSTLATTLADAIKRVPAGGSDAWDAVVLALLLSGVDLDHSGRIDSQAELDRLECPVWEAIEAGVRAGWTHGVRRTYGLSADLTWLGSSLGFDEPLRAAVDASAAGCGLKVDPLALTAATNGPPATQIASVSGAPNWEPLVRRFLVAAFDMDGSGGLDRRKEIRRIDCATWLALDVGVRSAWDGSSFRGMYGFRRDYIWVGYALGFSHRIRRNADRAIRRCEVPD